MKTSRCISIAFLTLVSSTLLVSSAAAQTALGGGNVLDNNLGVGSGGINQPRSAGANFRARNLIMTGDVIGGRGFRGSVGYTAEDDFRGRLGTNDLFDFRADSAISSPSLWKMGDTYEQLRYGQSIGLTEYRRSGSADPASLIANNPVVISDPYILRRVDRQSLSSSLSFTQAQAVEPRVIGSTYAEDGSLLYFNASTVRGIVVEPANRAASLLGLSTFDTARLVEDAMASGRNLPVGVEFSTEFNRFAPDVRGEALQPAATDQQPQATGNRIESSVTAKHDTIMKNVVDRYVSATGSEQASTPEAMRSLEQNYQTLREQLALQQPTPLSEQFKATRPDWQTPAAKPTPGPGEEPADSTAKPRESATQTPVRGLEHLTPQPGVAETPRATSERPPGTDLTPLPPDERRRAPLAKPELTGALKHGIRVDQLSTAMQGRFNELLESAEKALSEGEYFLAERRFERALRLVPGHPLANVGMAHAQLGAGLYLSSSLTLRTLLATQPEMIDVTYGRHLLPSQDRITAALDAVRTRMADAQPRDRGNYGFLLAYIGHQTDDEALIKEGLAAVREADASNALLPLLEEIWQSAEPSAPATPAPAAPPAEPQK